MLRFYNKKRVDIRKIIFYFNLAVFLCSAFYLLDYAYEGHKNKSKQEDLNDRVDNNLKPKVDEKGNIIDRYAGEIRDAYPDLVGRVTYHYYNKKIKLPVMQTRDNDFYLRRDVEGGDSEGGTPFVDFRCNVKDSMLMIIYGHNMKDLSQFGAIKEYKNESYCKKYPTVEFETMFEEPAEYEIVAAFYSQIYQSKVQDVFKYYKHYSLTTKEEYDDYVKNIKKMALYDTGITPQYGDKLIVMSTCDYTQHYKKGRFAILCRKKSDSKTEDDGLNMDDLKVTPTPTPTETPEPTEEVTATDSGSDGDGGSDNTDDGTSTATKKPTKTATPATVAPTKTPATQAPPTVAPTATPKPTATPTVAPTATPIEPTFDPSGG